MPLNGMPGVDTLMTSDSRSSTPMQPGSAAAIDNQRLAEIFKQAPAFMCALRGPQHVFELINDRYLQLVGNRPDLIGKTVQDALPEVTAQGFIALLDRVYQTGEPFIGIHLPILLQRIPGTAAEERIIDLTYSALRDQYGAITGILAHGVDQTERRNTDLALLSSQERYRTLLTSMDEGFCIVDLIVDNDDNPVDCLVLEANPAFEKHTGQHDCAGRTLKTIAPGFEQRWIDRYAAVARSGEPTRFIDHSEAYDRWFDVNACRIGEAGSIRIGIFFKDITERKRNEESLRQFAADLSEADRRKGEFLATLAHELRNPLAPIRSGLGVLRMSSGNPTMVAKVLTMMDRQVDHMVHLIDDLMDVARISGGKVDLRKQHVELKTMLASAIETSLPLIEAGKHELVVNIADEPLVLDADPTRIAQIFGNLLNNAAKYTPIGGKIVMSARRDQCDAVISVSDNGVGIEQASLSVIFEMFNQVGRDMDRSQGGLGIGLCLVQRLVEMHGGTVAATSDGINLGSSFTVRLPLVRAALTPAGHIMQPDIDQPAPAKALRVMVVDDNVDAAQSLCAILELKGHAVGVAFNGLQAVQVAKEFRPQIAFLDIGMPGMNGYEAAQALRKLPGLENIVLIALTGWGAANDRGRSREAGFDHHLTKPAELATLDGLLARLNESLDSITNIPKIVD